jgi:hypothetical protein
LAKRFQKLANAFFIRFNPRPPGRLSQLRAGRRSLIWVLQFFLCLAGFACEQSEQRSHHDQQNEKEIIEVHVSKTFKSLKKVASLHRYIVTSVHDSRFTIHVASPRDLSPPAIDSRMEVSA